MYKLLNKQNKINYSNNAAELGLINKLNKFGTVYYCGSNNRMDNNVFMQNIWNKQKTLNSNIQFKNCFSNVHYSNGDSYYLITQNGQLYVGGQGDGYVLGTNRHDNQRSFRKVATDNIWKKVTGRYGADGNYPTSYFLTQNGKLFFSGRQNYAFYGNGSYINLGNIVTQFDDNGVLVQDIQCFYGGSIILDKDGYIWSKGYNRYGQLGDGNSGTSNDNQRQNYYRKIALPNETPKNDWVKIAASFYSCYALNRRGQLYSWGYNQYGGLGIGNNQECKSTPQLVSNGSLLFDDVSAGSYHMICKDIEGNIYTVGRNNYGQLGDGTTIDKNSLTKIFSNINARKVVAGQYNSAVIDVQGGCYCVGYSNNTIINGYTGNVLQWLKLGYVNKITHISMCKNSFCLIGE